MKKLSKKIFAFALALAMMLSYVPSATYAEETMDDLQNVQTRDEMPEAAEETDEIDYKEKYVVMAVEAFSIGEGFIMEPTKMSVADIVDVWAEDGVEIDPEQLTAAQATYAFFKNAGLETEPELGDDYYGSSFYLSNILGVAKESITVPSYVEDGFNEYNSYELEIDDNDDNDLGEFDYYDMSGWMFTVGNEMADVGAGSYVISDDLVNNSVSVVRWQYTLCGYGSDLGFDNTSWGGYPAFFERVDRSELYDAYAEKVCVLDKKPETKEEILSIVNKGNATKKEIDDALSMIDGVDKISVYVNAYDYTAAKAGVEGASKDGVVLETTVRVSENESTLNVIKKAFEDNGIEYEASFGYISSINGLGEKAEGYPSSGWMMAYNNDDYDNWGVDYITLMDGDTIRFDYTLDMSDIAPAFSGLPTFKTLTIGGVKKTFSTEITYDEDWNSITSYLEDGKTIVGDGTKANPFKLTYVVDASLDITKLTVEAETYGDSHYVTVEPEVETADFSKPLTFAITSNGGRTAYYEIKAVTLPKKATLSSVISPSTGKMTVKWVKDSKADGYQICYSTSSSFSSAKTTTVTSNATVSKTIGSLTAGKTYYFKVRSYKVVDGVKKYGAYSAAKKEVVRKTLTKGNITSLKSNSKKSMTLKWKKDSKASGYQITYSTSSKFKNAKSVYVTSYKTVSKKITGLSSNKKYYVKIRSYQKSANGKYYGSYSKVKTIKVK